MKKIYKITGMDCVSCANLIELELEDMGFTAKCNFPKEELIIESGKVNVEEEEIKKKIKDLGYEII